MTTPVDPIGVAVTVAGTLDALGIPNSIGGSIASSLAGEPRSTVDIDIVAALSEEHVPAIVDALSSEFYVDATSLHRAIRTAGVANLIHQTTQLKIDIHVAGGSPLDGLQLERRRRVEVGNGRVLHVHPPEDILLQKLRWYRKGGEVSDRQWRDVLAIIRVQASQLDRLYLREHAPVLGVDDLLTRALREASR